MNNFLNPKWILLVNTLPVCILISLFLWEFEIIETLLKPSHVCLWISFGFTLAALSVLNVVYAIFLVLKRRQVSMLYGFGALILYVVFIYVYCYYYNDIIPRNIPRWMFSGSLNLYVGTFLMPTLAHALFVIVIHVTNRSQINGVWLNFVVALSIPFCWYVFAQVIMPLWQPVENSFFIHTVLILLIISTISLLLFLIRGIYILAINHNYDWKPYHYAYKVTIAIILPIIGLLLNNGHLFDKNFGSTYIFGNFDYIGFYALAIINGLFICLPNINSIRYRYFLFIGRSMTFAYTCYFFIVFLPYLPLTFLALIVFGLGILILAPTALFILHVKVLTNDIAYLRSYLPNRLIQLTNVLSILLIPIVLTLSITNDKKVLLQSIEYIDAPHISQNYDINIKSLKKTIKVIRSHRSRTRNLMFNQNVPYISFYFNWLVFDNLTLSRLKINKLESVFFDTAVKKARNNDVSNDQVELTDVSVRSHYDRSTEAWISWIDMELANMSQRNMVEYSTTISLPEGCWISDYYLYVGGNKEMGILAEKKAAKWIYAQIRGTRKDPGILYHLNGEKVAFRVFPFSSKEVRKSGIQFIHKDPVTLHIDGSDIDLGNARREKKFTYEDNVLAYVPADQKSRLKLHYRKPYFHFVLDASQGSKMSWSSYMNGIDRLTERYPALLDGAKMSIVNSHVKSILLTDQYRSMDQSIVFQGGFFLERAIQEILINSYEDKSKSYPIMVILTDDMDQAINGNDYSDLSMTYPDKNHYYHITQVSAPKFS